MSMINANDTIGNRTRDLPPCSAVPPRAHTYHMNVLILMLNIDALVVKIPSRVNLIQYCCVWFHVWVKY